MIVCIYGIFFGYKDQFIICDIVKFCSIQNIYFFFIILNFNNNIHFVYYILFKLFKVLGKLINKIFIYVATLSNLVFT